MDMNGNMTKAAKIRALNAEGLTVPEIHEAVGGSRSYINYVINKPEKPVLTLEILQAGGFDHVASWTLDEDQDVVGIKLVNPKGLSDAVNIKGKGVYAFVSDVSGKKAQYVGVATICIEKRMKDYGRGYSGQSTNYGIKKRIIDTMSGDNKNIVELWFIAPEDQMLRDFPIDTAVGLEAGLIRKYELLWNRRGS